MDRRQPLSEKNTVAHADVKMISLHIDRYGRKCNNQGAIFCNNLKPGGYLSVIICMKGRDQCNGFTFCLLLQVPSFKNKNIF